MAERSPDTHAGATRIPWLSREGKFRFELGLRQNDGSFFRPSSDAPSVLSARRDILAAHPTRHAAMLEEGTDLLNSARAFAQSASGASLSTHATSHDSCLDLGRSWEPDFLLLKPTPDSTHRLVGGCVCFPSSWDLAEKMGDPIAAIHAPVPTLNESLGGQISAFLNRIKPGPIWERWNWGLAAVDALNHHPALAHPRLHAASLLEETWLRLEHQTFRALDDQGGLLFAIRVSVLPLTELAASSQAAHRLAALLETMPEEIAAYKVLTASRPSLISQLRAVPQNQN